MEKKRENSIFQLLPCYVRGGEWFFEKSGSRKIFVEFHGSHSLVFLAVMRVSQSRFLYEALSESRLFARLEGFRSSDSFVCFNK